MDAKNSAEEMKEVLYGVQDASKAITDQYFETLKEGEEWEKAGMEPPEGKTKRQILEEGMLTLSGLAVNQVARPLSSQYFDRMPNSKDKKPDNLKKSPLHEPTPPSSNQLN